MKDVYFWSLLSAFYLLMVHLGYPVLAQGPPGIQPTNPSNVGSSSNPNPNQQFRPPQAPASKPLSDPPATPEPSGNNNNNNGSSTLLPPGFWDQFGINDPLIRQNLVDLYGTVLGQPDCVKKSMCVLGNTFHDLPGRDFVFTFLGRYVPSSWGILYDIFRVSIMYGQSCNGYVCNMTDLPEPTLPNFLTQLNAQSSMWMNLFGLSSNGSSAATGARPTATPRPVVVDNALHKDPNPEDLQHI